MTKRFLIVAATLIALGLTSCSTEYEALLSSNDVEAKYTEAFNLYNTQKYKKAASMFESLSMLTTGTSKDDTVRYYWALSNYRYKDFYTAEANFTSYIDLYPRSTFSAEARFLKLDCMCRSTYRYELDQNPTRATINAISEYMIEYPSSPRVPLCKQMLLELNERLDRKEYENALLYYKMENYISAKTAFRNILKDHPDNLYREDVMYYLAKSNYKYAQNSVHEKQRERYMEFTDVYLNFVSELPDSKYRKELDHMYANAQSAIAKKK